SRRRHTRFSRDWSSDVCSSDLEKEYFTAKDTISYVYKSFKDISQYLVSNEDKTDTAYFAISYPEFEDLGLNEAVRPYILLDGDRSEERRVGKECRARW